MAFWIHLENVRCFLGSGEPPLAHWPTRGLAASRARTEPIDLEQPDPQNWVQVGPFLVRICVERISFTPDGRPIYHLRTEGGPPLPVGGDVEHGHWFFWTLPFIVDPDGRFEKGPFRGHFDVVW